MRDSEHSFGATIPRASRFMFFTVAAALGQALGGPGLAHAEDPQAGAEEPAAFPSCSAESAQELQESGKETGYDGAVNPGASIERFPDGGKIYSYRVGQAIVRFPVPPREFDPKTASANELARYGIPSRPDEPEERAEWDRTWGNMGVPAPPGGCVASNEEYAEESENPIWSGFEALDLGHPSHFGAVTGQYNQPAYHGDSCSGPEDNTVSWVGLGGTGAGKLLQDGTGLTSSYEYFAWYEALPSPPVHLTLTVKAGDLIQDNVTYSGGTASFLVQNLTRGTSASGFIEGASSLYDGAGAEWIDERPTIIEGGKERHEHLANFETVNWHEAKDYNNVSHAWEGISAGEHWRIHMWNDKKTHQLAAPGFLSSATSFQDNWLACE